MVMMVMVYLYKVMVTYFQVMMDKLVNKLEKIQLYQMLMMVKNLHVILVSFVLVLMANVMELLIMNQSKVYQKQVYYVYQIHL
jgi:hypothetical protein